MALVRPKRTVGVPKKPAARPAGPSPTGTARRVPEAKARVFALDVPFAMRGVASACGATWDRDHGVFVYRGEPLPAGLAPFAPLAYSWEAAVQRVLDRDAGLDVPRARRGGEGSLVPRPHQAEAIRLVVASAQAGRPGFLLADDVGLGKTISAWASVQKVLGDRPAARVLVVSPLAVLAHWRRTIEAMGDGGSDVVVMNYERLGKLFEVAPEVRKTIKSKKGLARKGEAPAFDVIVWDESHKCKNPSSARSKLAAKLTEAAGFCLWLSATAGQNPLELSYLAKLLAAVLGKKAKDLKDFEAFCQSEGLGLSRGAYGKWEWRGGPSDVAKVRAMLFEPHSKGSPPAGLRRRPEDVAGWPAIQRILAPIELDPEARVLYMEAWTAFRKELSLAPQGRDPKSGLAAVLRFRQKGSLVRVPGTAELVRELLESGHKVAVSVAFVETLERLREELSEVRVAVIHGAMSAGEREAERLAFQREERDVVLFTVEEGISLHQGEHGGSPRSSVVHDLRWSAIQMAQIEGRCHRDGKFAQVYWAYADGTIEERIAKVVVRRLLSMKEMIGDDTETVKEIEALLVGPGEGEE
ncbi:MAG: DEAD/DEAH box helicase [Myxococcales bacterium]|nr:DEAD/DEAH box helicase [Myxococcales bacterium]